MPLIFNISPVPDCYVMVWKIEETAYFFKRKLGKENYQLEEYKKISHPHKKLEWLASRFLAKYLAQSLYLNYTGLIKDAYNKPFLLDLDHHLSLSHTVTHVVAGIHLHKAIGIDLEDITPRLHIIKHKFLTDSERKNANEELNKLTIYWSAKESLYKLYGKKGVQFQTELSILPFEQHDNPIFGKINIIDFKYEASIFVYKILDAFLTIAI